MTATASSSSAAGPDAHLRTADGGGRDSELTRRALYYSPPNSFAFTRPEVPCHTFEGERARAVSPEAAAGLIPLDISRHLGLDAPATTPMLVMRYLRLRKGEALSTRFAASGEIYCVLTGRGESRQGSAAVAWREGDVFCLPGGEETRHLAHDADAVLYVATNEPQLALERLEPPAPGRAAVEAVHYPAEEIAHQTARLCAAGSGKDLPAKAVLLTSEAMRRWRTCTPTVTVGVNTFEPGDSQVPHRHNAVAVTLCLRAGTGMYSLVDGQRVEWREHAVMITPPTAVHSHHNEGEQTAVALVIQDSGLYFHTRATGFSYA